MPSQFFAIAIAIGLAWGILPLFIGLKVKTEALFGKMGCDHLLFMLEVQAFGRSCVVPPLMPRSWRLRRP